MKIALRLVTVITLLLMVFGPSTSASAADIVKSKGFGGEFYFSTVDATGCILTDVTIYARDAVSQNPPGPGEPESWAFLYISQYDYCAGTELLYIEGMTLLAKPDFQVSKQLSSATLNTTINVYDYVSGANFDVAIDLTATGSGPLVRQNSRYHYHSPGCHVNSRLNGGNRQAEVSGTVSYGETNFTPEAGWGNLLSAKTGDMYIDCN
jgi:hypothetical protein